MWVPPICSKSMTYSSTRAACRLIQRSTSALSYLLQQHVTMLTSRSALPAKAGLCPRGLPADACPTGLPSRPCSIVRAHGHTRQQSHSRLITMAAATAGLQVPVKARLSDEMIELPALRQLSLQAILALGFQQDDAAVILEVRHVRQSHVSRHDQSVLYHHDHGAPRAHVAR